MRFSGSHCGKNWDIILSGLYPSTGPYDVRLSTPRAEGWCPLCGHKFPMKEVA